MRPFSISAMGATTVTTGSSWLPTDVSGLQAWWKTETLDTQGMTTGDDINNAAGKYWPDSSGNTSDMAAVSSTNAPNYTTSVVNGKSVARFTRANSDRLTLKSGSTSAPSEQKPVTVFAVLNPAAASGFTADFIGASGTTGYRFRHDSNGKVNLSVSGSVSTPSTTTISAGTWYILIWTLDGSDNFAYYINSTTADATTGTFVQSPAAGNRQLSGSAGGTTTYDGDMAEAGQYNTVLSATNRSNLCSYLSSKYAIDVLDDSFTSGQTANRPMDPTDAVVGHAQSFTSAGGTLRRADFYIQKVGSPSNTTVAKLYAITGVSGTSAIPTSTALATSDTINDSAISTTAGWVTFTFSGANQFSMVNGTTYCIAIEHNFGDSSNYIRVYGNASFGHGGNHAYLDNTLVWNPLTSVMDLNFAVYI